ncbi:hypothetical protein VT50_0228425 [Streptomyces antioxidans]|uniref:Septum formation-related domain-containing protein n=1 Tax=Streptomyces antioxidans TaxID=1507734 RepID=A0A1V4CYF4_9ACTN|nr:hypothetical protein VT50_0228425 [Streptomyces antioxidans]
MPPPPPPPGTGGSRTTAVVIAAVVAVAVVIGAIVIGTKDDGGKKTSAGGDPSASASDRPLSSPSDAESSAAPAGSEDPGEGAPLGGGSDAPDDGDPGASDSAAPDASESGAPGDKVPYVVLDPGKCFDHPAMDSSVTKVEKRSCDGPHDGEVIANETLSGDFSTEKAIQTKALALCETDAKKRLKSIPNDGRMYYYYALYPALATYSVQGEDQVSCALTLSAGQDGKKLGKPLPG